MTVSGDGFEPVLSRALPDGLHVREVSEFEDQEPPEGEGATRQVCRLRITGRSPDFWWELVITRGSGADGGHEFHCTRCGHSDQADTVDDVLRLISAGAHLHDIDPAGGGGAPP